ncbi:MAG: FecR family protein [Flavisolibacter sp.]
MYGRCGRGSMKERIEYLYRGYRSKNLSFEELAEWLQLLSQPAVREEVEKLADAEWQHMEKPALQSSEVDWDFMFASITREETPVVQMKTVRFGWKRITIAAASVLVLLFAGYFLLMQRDGKEVAGTLPIKGNIQMRNDVSPAHDAVVLTLGNGRKILVDSLSNGAVSLVNGTTLEKDDSALNYDGTESSAGNVVTWNTVETPRGRQFQLVLADGTKVWLNAASSIRFPTAFTESERRVELTGETYFEVAHDPEHPFVVSVNGVQVKVLGTHFNVNAYEDSKVIRTTLLEGKVEVSKGNRKVTLLPGQQARVEQGDVPFTVLSNQDTESVVAWKEGIFYFDNAGIKTILRELARWYDINVVYNGALPDKSYFMIMSRGSKLSSVLAGLRATDLSFKIEGKNLFVQTAGKN